MKIQTRENNTKTFFLYKIIGTNLMWDSAVSQQSHVSSTEQAHVGQSSLLLGQTSLKWVRAVLYGIELHHMGQSSIMWV